VTPEKHLPSPTNRASADAASRPRNRYDRFEWAGALGDLGTLIPFGLAYITVLGLDPLGVLFGFGASMVAAGWFYKTPFPVQPMKAAGAVATTQAAQTATITEGAVVGAGLVTGLIWLALGLTGLAGRITRLISRPVAQGIVLGLGMGFMLQGARLMAAQWFLGGLGLLISLLLARSKRFPAIFVVLALGAAWTAAVDPAAFGSLSGAGPNWRWPNLGWARITWDELVVGTLFLALPQVPLTLGNAVIAVREENNRLFPDRLVDDRKVSLSTGLMNLFGSSVGGVPMCHGAGGMAAHVAYGARTGGSLVILGAILLIASLFFSDSIVAVLEIVPEALLGTILFMTGAQLVSGQLGQSRDAVSSTVLLVTAGLCMWNVGIGFLVGLALQALLLRDTGR
jgi:MFS superfamily sulfate permease-like transporter